MKIIETKEVSKTLLAVLTAGILSLVGCQEKIDESAMISSSREMTPSSQSSEETPKESQSSEPTEEPKEVIPEAPEVKYSEWTLGEWTTELQEENDLCRLADQQTKSEPVYSAWSAWSTEYVEASATREVTTKTESDYVIDHYEEISVNDQYGYPTGKTVLRPAYKRDENGYFISIEQTFYSYRDLISTNAYTLYQYETREVTNQEEIDAYYQQYPEALDEKKLILTQE